MLVALGAIGPGNEAIFKSCLIAMTCEALSNHVCVLFVQHSPENALQQSV